jgi:UV DNA damage endonuclease
MTSLSATSNIKTNVRLGYACINNSLTYPTGRTSTTCRINSVYKAGTASGKPPGSPEYSKAAFNFLIQYGLKNTQHIIAVLQWHIKSGMKFYRMSSELFPHIDNEMLRGYMTDEDIDTYRELTPFLTNIHKIAQLAHDNGIRLTMHPDPYAVLASPDADKVATTVRTLKWHARLFQVMESYIMQEMGIADAFKDSILCLHIGGRYDKLGGRPGTLLRWANNFRTLLPQYVQKHVCVENCEKNFNAQDLLPLCEELQIPLIFDFHHYNCYPLYHPQEPKQMSLEELVPKVLLTWERRGMTPKFHLSDQDTAKSNVGAHAEFVNEIPSQLLKLIDDNYKLDIMVEAKAKDFAVFYLLSKYPHLNNTNITDPYKRIPANYPSLPMFPSSFNTSTLSASVTGDLETTVNQQLGDKIADFASQNPNRTYKPLKLINGCKPGLTSRNNSQTNSEEKAD